MHIVRYVLFLIALALLGASIQQFINGYRAWQAAQLAEQSYLAELKYLEEERDRLKHRIQLLKTDELTKQRLARKRMGYIKSGELKYKIVKPKMKF